MYDGSNPKKTPPRIPWGSLLTTEDIRKLFGQENCVLAKPQDMEPRPHRSGKKSITAMVSLSGLLTYITKNSPFIGRSKTPLTNHLLASGDIQVFCLYNDRQKACVLYWQIYIYILIYNIFYMHLFCHNCGLVASRRGPVSTSAWHSTGTLPTTRDRLKGGVLGSINQRDEVVYCLGWCL